MGSNPRIPPRAHGVKPRGSVRNKILIAVGGEVRVLCLFPPIEHLVGMFILEELDGVRYISEVYNPEHAERSVSFVLRTAKQAV